MIFSSAELSELATAPADRALQLLADGYSADALAVARASVRAYQPILNIYTTWNALSLGLVERQWGRDEADACLRESLAPPLRPLVELFRNGATPQVLQLIVQLLRMDALQIDGVEEDEQSLRLRLHGWAGERVAALPAGATIDFSRVLRTVESLCVEWLGYPPLVFDADVSGEGLQVCFHKNPVQIPARYFDRVDQPRDVARLEGCVSTAGARLFSDEARERLGRNAFVLAHAALERGDLAAARRQLVIARSEWFPTHHFLRDWVTGQLSWLQRRHGVQAVWDSVEAAYNRPLMGAMLQAIEGMELRAQIEMLAVQFHEHAMQFRIVETDDGFEFRTAPCGSGGRLIDEQAYAAPKAFGMVREDAPSLHRFGVAELPVYCMHCPATNRMVLERGGPYFLLVEPDLVDGRVRGHCSFHVFKRPEAVPAAMYHRVGLDPPAAEKCRAARTPS